MVLASGRVSFAPSDDAPSFSQIIRLTSGPAREWAPAISPDGKWVAYLSNAREPTDIWVQFIAGGEAIHLSAPAGLEVTPGTGIGGLDIRPMARVSRRWLACAAPLVLSRHGRCRLRFQALLGSCSRTSARFAGRLTASKSRSSVPEDRPATPCGWPMPTARIVGDHSARRRPTYSLAGVVSRRIDLFHRHEDIAAEHGAVGNSRIDPARPVIEPVIATARRAIFPMPLPTRRGFIYAANPDTAESGLWWRASNGGPSRRITVGLGEVCRATRVSRRPHARVHTVPRSTKR